MKTVKQIVVDELKRMGADGLCATHCFCSCLVHQRKNFMGCEGLSNNCVPAKLVNGKMVPMEATKEKHK